MCMYDETMRWSAVSNRPRGIYTRKFAIVGVQPFYFHPETLLQYHHSNDVFPQKVPYLDGTISFLHGRGAYCNKDARPRGWLMEYGSSHLQFRSPVTESDEKKIVSPCKPVSRYFPLFAEFYDFFTLRDSTRLHWFNLILFRFLCNSSRKIAEDL